MSKLDFAPANPNDMTSVHAPDGSTVECTVANAHDLIRLNGYFWKAEEAAAAQAVAAAEEAAAAPAEEAAAEAPAEAPAEPEAAAEAPAEAPEAEAKPKRGRAKAGA